jgi:hypothetical protein
MEMNQGAFLTEVGGPKITHAREASAPLLTPHRMGDLDRPNCVVMAPLTRMRANPDESRAHDSAGRVLRATRLGGIDYRRGHGDQF